jgi:hypothetical protein
VVALIYPVSGVLMCLFDLEICLLCIIVAGKPGEFGQGGSWGELPGSLTASLGSSPTVSHHLTGDTCAARGFGEVVG